MMKYWLITLAMLAGWGGVGNSSALAQFGYNPPQVNPNPTVSPYLNLIPNNPYVNYFGIAQTQVSNTRGLQQLQQQVATPQPTYYPLGTANPALQPNMMTTGHAVTFQNFSHYFPTPGAPFAGMGMSSAAGAYGTYNGYSYPSVNAPLSQGYAQGMPR